MVRAINDPQKIVVFYGSICSCGIGGGASEDGQDFVEGHMVSALRELGADYVLDVAFSADLTIMEEGNGISQAFSDRGHPLPQFTSCCPAWVESNVETFHP